MNVKLRLLYGRRSHLTALLALAGLVAAFLGYLALDQARAAASEPTAPASLAAATRQFYLTETFANGSQALGACAPGYHMASLWEILDVSNLRYDIDLGQSRADSGAGPPTYLIGWARTGYSSSGAGAPGQVNCQAWTSPLSNDSGTVLSLDSTWWSTPNGLATWDTGAFPCNEAWRVWCVADGWEGGGVAVFLPLVFRNAGP
jgi:hypothetical protein